MVRKFLNAAIVFFEPSMLIPNREWLENWKIREKNSFQLSCRVLCLGIAIIYALHYPLVDIPAKKSPLDLWLFYRISVSFVALLGFATTFSKWFLNASFFRLPAFLSIVFTVYMQGQSMIWRPQVPFFYVPLFAFIGTFSMRLSPGKSSIVFALIIGSAYQPFLSRPDDTQHLVSGSIVAAILLMMFRSSMKTEVLNYILENENKNSQMRLIETQIEMNEQIRSFLPLKIYQRVNELVQKNKRTPLQAVDEVLRPRRVAGAVLFSDIRGYTSLSKSKGYEAALTAIIPAQKSCTNIVEGFEGIPKLEGDLIFAYYDNDLGDENILNALKSAVSIAQSTVALNERIRMHETIITRYVIVAFGDLVVGNLGGTEGSRSVSVIGNAANLPSRIDPITKDQRIKKILEDAPLILSEDAFQKIDKMNLSINFYKLCLTDFSIVIRDFEEQVFLYLVPRSEFEKISSLEVRALDKKNRVAA